MGPSSGSPPPPRTINRPPLPNRQTERPARAPPSAASGSGHNHVFSRLQALFPHHEDNPASPRNSLSDRLVPNLTISSPPPVRKIPEKSADSSPPHEHPFLKIKIITWNMHESLPHGDLRALLGSVPPHVPLEVRDGSLPPLPTDDDHPFHIVIVAGQECPTHSGIPMGLGATFKDRHKDREKQPEREASRRDKDREKERQRHSRNAKGDTNAFVPGTLSSWSAILEDWFQNGVGSMSGVQPALREASAHIKDLHPAPSMPMEASASAPAAMESAPENVWDLPTEDYHLGGPYLGWNIPEHGGTVTLSAEQARLRAGVKGPYVLLCKERLMGIYIAVFVQRDCRPLVKGYSTGTVTAGLIGGRVGNKGGAGVSINFAGVRLLFVNAHLAAHEGKVALRLANLHKIKNELEVDTFLPPNDPRLVSEDVTDRFDYTFVFGDLNFRLDLSRLHADWLISRRDYAQALEFDQLHKLIQEGKVDFQEEPPRFPPTYKYDVRRRSIRDAVIRRPGHRRRITADTVERLEETDEHGVATDREEHDDHDDHEHDHENEHGRPDFESSSFISNGSAWTGSTIWTTDADEDEDDEDDDDEENLVAASLAAAAQAAHKLLALPAAQKARTKFMDFLGRPNSPATSSRPTSITPESMPTAAVDAPLNPISPIATHMKPPMGRSLSTRTHLSRATLEEEEVPTSYDTSSKQRVPSWCDRILWKTTVPSEPDPTPDSEDGGFVGRGSFRRGYFSNAWAGSSRIRPAVDKGRRNSTSTIADSQPDSSGADSPTSPHVPSPHSSGLLRRNTDRGVMDHDEEGYAGSESPPHPSKPRLLKSTTFDPDRPFAQWHTKWKKPRSKGDSAPSSPSVVPVAVSPPRLPPVLVDSTSLMPTPQTEEPKSSASLGTASKWWHHLPGLLSRASMHDQTPSPTIRSDPRRGDVVVLCYKTLDDAEMRSLDARSDHRPVIGAYAIYI